MTGKGIDLSFSRISRAWAEARRAEGVRVLYQDAFTGGPQSSAGLKRTAGPNVQDAIDAGIPYAGFYTNVAPWHVSGAYCLDQARIIAGPLWDTREFVVIDLEIAYWQPTGEWLDEQIVHDAIAEAKRRGFRVLLYTATWVINFWALRLGHMPRFDCDGIYARYDGDPTLAPSQAPACITGRWIGKQYGGDKPLDGADVDLNTFELSWFEEDGMADADLIKVILDLRDWDGRFAVDGFITWQVSWPPAADYPTLRRVDNSNASIITAPVRSIPLAVAAYLPKGPDI